MLVRNLLLVLGALFVLAGAAIGFIWLRQGRAPETANREAASPAHLEILSAAHAIPSGTLLQQGDITWKDIDTNQLRPGNLVRGQMSEDEFLGAVTTRDFTDGEALVASELIKFGDRRFLAAALKPGRRAASIFVDAAQSSSGLVLPGNHVDIILTQIVEEVENTSKKHTVAETVLRDVRIIAVDQSLNQQPKPGSADGGALDARVPKTVTIELTARQAQILSVAEKLGQIQISVRPLENEGSAAAAEDQRLAPTWGNDVSPALRGLKQLKEELAKEVEARKAAEQQLAELRRSAEQAALEAKRRLAEEAEALKKAEEDSLNSRERFQNLLEKTEKAETREERAKDKIQALKAEVPHTRDAPRLYAACAIGQRQPCGTGSTLEKRVRWPPRAFFYAQNAPAPAAPITAVTQEKTPVAIPISPE